MRTDIRFGIIGLGLMGREFASAAARQPFYCATPPGAHQSHLIFTQALASYLGGSGQTDGLKGADATKSPSG